MPIPILIAAAEFLLGPAVVESAAGAALEWLGMTGGVAVLRASLQAFVIRWTPAAIDALEATLNPLPTYGGMAAAAGVGARDSLHLSAGAVSPHLAQFSEKERLLMATAIRLARRAGVRERGAQFIRYLLDDLRTLESLGGHMAGNGMRSEIPAGISGMGFLKWLPMNGKDWTYYVQQDAGIAIEKVAQLNRYTDQTYRRAAKTALAAIERLESGESQFAHFARHIGVHKFVRLLANGELCVVYEAPACGEVVLTVSKSTEQAAVNNGLLLHSMERTRVLWSRSIFN
jgi:hypothetical protein